MVRIETFPRHIVTEMYASFKKIAPVRILVKIANVKDLPPGLPDNVKAQKWFSQSQILSN